MAIHFKNHESRVRDLEPWREPRQKSSAVLKLAVLRRVRGQGRGFKHRVLGYSLKNQAYTTITIEYWNK